MKCQNLKTTEVIYLSHRRMSGAPDPVNEINSQAKPPESRKEIVVSNSALESDL